MSSDTLSVEQQEEYDSLSKDERDLFKQMHGMEFRKKIVRVKEMTLEHKNMREQCEKIEEERRVHIIQTYMNSSFEDAKEKANGSVPIVHVSPESIPYYKCELKCHLDIQLVRCINLPIHFTYSYQAFEAGSQASFLQGAIEYPKRCITKFYNSLIKCQSCGTEYVIFELKDDTIESTCTIRGVKYTAYWYTAMTYTTCYTTCIMSLSNFLKKMMKKEATDVNIHLLKDAIGALSPEKNNPAKAEEFEMPRSKSFLENVRLLEKAMSESHT
jgi:hypothetical protein